MSNAVYHNTLLKEWKFYDDTTQSIIRTCNINEYSNSRCIVVQLVSSRFPIVVKIGHAHAGSGKVSYFSYVEVPYIYFTVK